MHKPSLTKDDNSKHRQFLLMSLIILISGLILRLIHLGFSYSNDELSALSRVRFDTFSELVSKGFFVDGHPGGIQVLLYYWVKLVGMEEWAVRLPFALAGAAGIWFTIKLFNRWFGPVSGLLSGAFIAFLPFPLLFSQIARPYGTGMTFGLIMAWYWTKLLFDNKPRVSVAFAYALSAAACMYNHYFSFLLALVMGLTGLFIMKKDRVFHYTGAGLLAAILFSPHIPITLNHLSIGGVGLWLAKPGWNWPLQHLAYLSGNSLLIAGLLLLIVLLQIRYYKESEGHSSVFRILSLIFFILPMITGFFYSRAINPVLQDSVLIFSFPFLLGFIFSFSNQIPGRTIFPLTSIVLATGIFYTVAIHNYYNRQHFGEFRGVARSICHWNQTYGKEKITRAISVNNPWYIEFYMERDNGCTSGFSQTDNRGEADLDTLKQILSDAVTPYFAYAWTKPVPLEIRDMILARFPCIVESNDFSGLSEATLYASNMNDACINSIADTLFHKVQITDTLNPGAAPEFYPGFEGRLNEIVAELNGQLIATAVVRAPESSGALLTASFHDENGETLQWAASKFDLFSTPGSWSVVRLTIPVDNRELFHKRMKIYIWNPKQQALEIKSLTIQTFNK